MRPLRRLAMRFGASLTRRPISTSTDSATGTPSRRRSRAWRTIARARTSPTTWRTRRLSAGCASCVSAGISPLCMLLRQRRRMCLTIPRCVWSSSVPSTTIRRRPRTHGPETWPPGCSSRGARAIGAFATCLSSSEQTEAASKSCATRYDTGWRGSRLTRSARSSGWIRGASSRSRPSASSTRR